MPNILSRSPFEIFVKYGGVYKSPEDRNENLLGPLVAYDRTYIDANGNRKNYVGFYYYNFFPIKQSTEALEYFSKLLAEAIKANLLPIHSHIFVAGQDESILATTIADVLLYPKHFLEKKVLSAPDPQHGRAEDSILIHDPKKIQPNENYIICESVHNNSDTTKEMIDFIEFNRGNVTAVACILNSSKNKSFCGVPVISVIHIPTSQYRQDDVEVKKLMDAYNIVWEPKKNWAFLQREM